MSGSIARLIFVAVIALGCAVPSVAASDPALIIDGTASGSRNFTMTDLRAMPRTSAKRDDHGHIVTCEGVALIDVLAKVGLPTGETLRGLSLTTIVVASARDGYRVAFTLGELDRTTGNAGAIIADKCDGKALGAEAGPLRLILPADQRPARSVRQLERLTVTTPR